MRKYWYTVLGLLIVSLAACQGTTESSLPAVPEAGEPTTVPAAVDAPVSAGLASCSMVSILPSAEPTEQARFTAAEESDWKRGSETASVTIINYGDFQCPYCAVFAPVLEQLLLDFPDDLQVVFRQFPLIRRLDDTILHDKAALAAQASEAAGSQGAFWPMHDLLYARQEEWQDLSVEEFEVWLVTEAGALELDTEIFQRDLTSQFLADYAEVSYLWGVENGLPGTPYLLINGIPYTGPLDYYNLSILVELYNLEKRQFSECPPMTIDPTAEYLATIITEKGDILLRLFPDVAPMAVNSFIFLVENDWYDNVTFHRVLDWMAQGGDPTGTGVGGPGYLYDLEPWPDLLFDRPGLVAMANSGPGTNGGQFFITKAPAQWLDGNYTIFGDVIGGLDVVNSITLRDPSTDPFAPLGDLILDITIEGP